jgi:glycosyltransferase involved in cell wall biosynthesis
MLAGPERPDVCLLCEGTYPYIAGGVSSWVHDIIKGEPQVTFSVLNIGSHPGWHGPSRFQFPANVLGLADLFCQDAPPTPVDGPERAALDRDIRRCRRRAARRSTPSRLLRGLRRLHLEDTVDDDLLADLAAADLSVPELLYGHDSFTLVEEIAERLAPDTSFSDLFWQCRAMNLPVVRLVGSQVAPAGSFHSLSAGYAGLLGAVQSFKSARPFLITEHGIYARERDIELARADWIPDRANPDPLIARMASLSPLRRLWSRFFRRLSQIAYHQAVRIVTLSEVNRQKQIADGAPPEKIRVVPNGVEAASASPTAAPATAAIGPLRVGFVGRLVPIKDLLTFVRACDLALREVPLDVRIIGPDDEDPAYAERCRQLVRTLRRQDQIRFLGMQPAATMYQQIDVLVLTSFSEGQPLVILEAFAAGVPAICTDVGCCREMIEGRLGADRDLGPSGIITRVAVPQDTARALVTLARDRGRLRRNGASAVRRLDAHYRRSTMLDSYRALYQEIL